MDFVMTQDSVLSVRMSKRERQLLEDAAEQLCTSVSDFVRRKALEAAEEEVLERRHVTIPADKWEAFEAWADRPAEAIPALEKLAKSKPTWQA